jgi:hypothetical protein
LTSRDRAHPATTTTSSSSSCACLACGYASSSESCSYCCLSAVVRALLLLLTPQPDLQAAFAEGAGLEVTVGCISGLAGGAAEPLLACLCDLLGPAVTGNRRAQDQVRGLSWKGSHDGAVCMHVCVLLPQFSDPLSLIPHTHTHHVATHVCCLLHTVASPRMHVAVGLHYPHGVVCMLPYRTP